MTSWWFFNPTWIISPKRRALVLFTESEVSMYDMLKSASYVGEYFSPMNPMGYTASGE